MSKILAIDYGEKRVGLATAIEELKVALPFGIIENKGYLDLVPEIMEICRKEMVTRIVVGIPAGLSGKPTEQTIKTKKFIEILREKTGIPVEEQSEIFTSHEARGIFKDAGVKKKRIDESAAVLILADYLERRG
ncbi:MAG: Holliday junction resolvase RuvX [bacterium]|nr:Holliday junction resolvase RuvX [bacterium]